MTVLSDSDLVGERRVLGVLLLQQCNCWEHVVVGQLALAWSVATRAAVNEGAEDAREDHGHLRNRHERMTW